MVTGTVALFVPGDRPERYAKAKQSGADIVIVDLEDAVGVERKQAARAAMAAADLDWSGFAIRINGALSSFYRDDLVLIEALRPGAVMVPKAEYGKALSEAATIAPVIALIETAQGLADARSVASTKGVVRLAFGSIDYCADVGCAHHQDALLFPRSELVLASRLADIAAPLDGVTTNVKDASLVESDARHAQHLGMGGKLCIHPAQIYPCRLGFRPSDSEVEWAKAVLGSGDAGVVALDGQMIDEPVRKRAESLLRRAVDQEDRLAPRQLNGTGSIQEKTKPID